MMPFRISLKYLFLNTLHMFCNFNSGLGIGFLKTWQVIENLENPVKATKQLQQN